MPSYLSFIAPAAAGWQRAFWLVLLVVASIAFSFVFACATPFAALATFAALTLPRMQAVLCVLVAWLANQLIGFGLLGYPPETDTFLWGGVMALAALAALFAARFTALHFQTSLARLCGAFMAANIAFQSAMYLAALSPLGGLADETFAIISNVVSINVVALAGMCGLTIFVGMIARSARFATK